MIRAAFTLRLKPGALDEYVERHEAIWPEMVAEIWADIRDQVARMGPVAEGFARWVAWVEETGGDPPEKAAALVLRIVGDDAAAVNGQFLWIEDGLQPPVPSWTEPGDERPW